MVKVKKFKAYIPPKDIAAKLICPPYDVVNTQEAREEAGDNPTSFLRVNRPDIEFPDDKDPHSAEIYERARDNLKKFVDNKYLVQDTVARVYIYAQKMGDHLQYGIVALSSIEDYENNLIMKHELTRKDKEEDRTKFTDIQNANIGPVFLVYKHKDTVDAVVRQVVTTQEPYSKVVRPDKTEHTLWLVDEFYSDFLIHELSLIPKTYIADGHHRAASAYNVGKMRREKALAAGKKLTGDEDFLYFMTLMYPDNQLKVLEYNRVLKTLCDKKEEEIFEKMKERYEVEELKGEDPQPKVKGHHSFYINKKWHSLKIKPGLVDLSHPIKSLDVEILAENVLRNIFGIVDIRSDKRIDFVGGIRGIKELERRCEKDCICAFAMHPVVIDEVMKVADTGNIMPPKSTWFEPKPCSGFLTHIIDDN